MKMLIRSEKYLPKEETKIEQLRCLDETTTKKRIICSLTLGIAGMNLSYPLNANFTKKDRERLALEILKLTSALMNGQT